MPGTPTIPDPETSVRIVIPGAPWTRGGAAHGIERDTDRKGSRPAAQNHPPANPQNDPERRTPSREGRPGVADPDGEHPDFSGGKFVVVLEV